MKRWLIVGSLLMLAACGGRVSLKPPEGKTLPPRAYGETATPDSDALLEPTSQTRPAHNAELLIKSEKRSDDPFDLPPGTDPAKVPMPTATPGSGTASGTGPGAEGANAPH